MAQYKTYSALVSDMNKNINIAVENACNRLLGTLQELIDTEYYDQFEPDFYIRSYQFWRSATTKMLTQNCGEIFMDEDAMNYGTYWDGELQLQFASRGYHGTTAIQTEGRFWQSFLDFCEQNAVRILKEELRKQGINIKRGKD